MYKTDYKEVGASQTADVLGSGKKGDILERLIIVPDTTSPGEVLLKDADGTNMTVFKGGASSVADLAPIGIPLGIRCSGATTPGWKVTTGANVSVIAVGRFG